MTKNKVFLFILLLPFFFLVSCNEANSNFENKLKDGDIVFQTSTSSQSMAIQIATRSPYSHVGIVFFENEKPYVYEAIEPVKKTDFLSWKNRGKDEKVVVKRLKNRDTTLTPEVIKKMKTVYKNFAGKHYDLYFEWSDNRIYCSELVWKIYKNGADIEIGTLEKLKDFDLSDPIVQQKLKERYGKNVPMDEVVISPVSIYNSDKLVTIK